MIKALVMLSGLLNEWIMYGKYMNKYTSFGRRLLFSGLNTVWLLLMIFLLLAEEWYDYAVIISLLVLYPLIFFIYANSVRKKTYAEEALLAETAEKGPETNEEETQQDTDKGEEV